MRCDFEGKNNLWFKTWQLSKIAILMVPQDDLWPPKPRAFNEINSARHEFCPVEEAADGEERM